MFRWLVLTGRWRRGGKTTFVIQTSIQTYAGNVVIAPINQSIKNVFSKKSACSVTLSSHSDDGSHKCCSHDICPLMTVL